MTRAEPRETAATAARPHVVRVTGATLGYGGTAVLRDVSIAIEPGQFWFFLGPNGAGKTTLVRAILGTIAPMSGAVDLNPAFSSRERIGFVPQRCDLNPSLPTTVREFVGLGLVGIARLGRDEQQRIAWALEKVGLEEFERADFHVLSGGQRQRVLVARALARRPRLLIADEPTSGLDPPSKTRLLEVLADLNRHERLTVVFVSHDLDVAEDYATHVALFTSPLASSSRPDDANARVNLAPETPETARGDTPPATLIAGRRADVMTETNLRLAYAEPPTKPSRPGVPQSGGTPDARDGSKPPASGAAEKGAVT